MYGFMYAIASMYCIKVLHVHVGLILDIPKILLHTRFRLNTGREASEINRQREISASAKR